MLQTKLIERAAEILYQSFNTVSIDVAWCMAIGEAETDFNTDLDIKLTPAIENQIKNQTISLETKYRN